MFNQRKTDPFFSALLAIAKNVQEAVHYADDFKVSSVADLKEVSIKLKNYETEGDKLIHELISKLNKSFMTPIEREDILQLANKMDDVLDGIEHFAAHLEMFSLVEIDEYIQKFMENIVNSTDEIVKAMHLLARKKLERCVIMQYLLKSTNEFAMKFSAYPSNSSSSVKKTRSALSNSKIFMSSLKISRIIAKMSPIQSKRSLCETRKEETYGYNTVPYDNGRRIRARF